LDSSAAYYFLFDIAKIDFFFLYHSFGFSVYILSKISNYKLFSSGIYLHIHISKIISS